MIQMYRAEFASLIPNNECELCSNFSIPFEQHKERVWIHCPECGRCCAKFFVDYDSEKLLTPVPAEYESPKPRKPIPVTKRESNDVKLLQSLLANDLTN